MVRPFAVKADTHAFTGAMQITDTGYFFCVGGKLEYRISVFLIGINDAFDITGNVFHQILL